MTAGPPVIPLCFWQCLSPASHSHSSSGPCFSQWPGRAWKTAVPALRKGVSFVRLQEEPWFRCVRAPCFSLAEVALVECPCIHPYCCIAVGLGLTHRDEPSLSLRPESVDPEGWNLSFSPSLVPSHGPSCSLKENTLILLDGFADHIFFFFLSQTVGRDVGCSLWGDILEMELYTSFPLTVLLWYKKFSLVLGYFELKETPLLFLYLASKSSK